MGAERNRWTGRPRALQALALAAGLLSAAVLAWAGLTLVHDPDRTGRAGLRRAAGEVADGLVAEWRRGDGLPTATLGARVEWRPGEDDALAVAAPHELSALRSPGSTTSDALLSEARRLEVIEKRPADALDIVLRALDQNADAPRVAEARLRAIQLAARLQRNDVVAAQWNAALAELHGDEAIDGVSVLLLDGLAAAPLLDDAMRAAAYETLAARWCHGTLALPDAVDALDVDAGPPAVVPARREALRARLVALAPDAAARDPRWSLDARRRQVTALAAALGGLPADVPLGEPVVRAGSPAFACVARRDGSIVGAFFEPHAVAGALRAAHAFDALLPPQFELAFDGERPARGEQVRERTPLLGDALGFTLWHADPDAFGDAESRRAAWLRGGLFLTALFAALAGVLSARTLGRARRLAELRAAFVAGVSHELRTPVSSILLLTENLQSGVADAPEARARYLGFVRREALRLRRLVEDVLDLARLERGEPLRLRREELALPAFAADLAREMAEVAARAGRTLHATVGTLPAGATLDAEALRRAVGNLVDNALKHGGESDVELAIGAASAGGSLVIRVRDGGPGVPPRDRERIFRPFERLDGAVGGSGLGLAIVRDIAQGHGGSARVEPAAPGPGAVFVLELPLAAEVPA